MGKVDFINKENLRIARENMGMSTSFVSGKFNKSGKDVVASWESGENLPTWRQISVLAKTFNIPELLFFSNDIIKQNKTIPDYRVSNYDDDSNRIKKLVNFVIKRQEWLGEKMKRDGHKNLLQGSGKDLNPKQLAFFIKTKLGISNDDIKNITGVDCKKNTLKYLIEKIESRGIFVGKTISHHRISVKEMRGLFISHDYCPFIVINRKDSQSAQIFSLVHELAHFFRKTEAVSNSLEFRKDDGINKEETFCNRVAVELLLPSDDFKQIFYTKSDIDYLSEVYKVSTLAIFYRLKELKKIKSIDSEIIESLIKKEQEENLKLKKNKEKNKSGGNYFYNMRDSNGNLFNSMVSKYYFENRIGYTEASNILRFSVESL